MNEEAKIQKSKYIKRIIIAILLTAAITAWLTLRFVMTEFGLTELFYMKQEKPSDSARANINKISGEKRSADQDTAFHGQADP